MTDQEKTEACTLALQKLLADHGCRLESAVVFTSNAQPMFHVQVVPLPAPASDAD